MKNINIIIFKILASLKFQALLITVITFILTPTSAFAATLSLSPSTGTFNKGCSFTLTINVDTAGAQTDGTDAVIRFDPTRVSASNINTGTIYNDFPGTNIDSTGKITISGLAAVSAPFQGSGTLATIDFTVPSVAPTGATALTFDFDSSNPTKTTDSNVIERNTVKDVLTSVTNGSYTIGSDSCATQTGTPGNQGVSGGGVINQGGGSVSTPSSTIPVKTLPPAGSEQLTFTMAIVGGILTILGLLGFALL